MMLDALVCWGNCWWHQSELQWRFSLGVPTTSAEGDDCGFMQCSIQCSFRYNASLLGQEII